MIEKPDREWAPCTVTYADGSEGYNVTPFGPARWCVMGLDENDELVPPVGLGGREQGGWPYVIVDARPLPLGATRHYIAGDVPELDDAVALAAWPDVKRALEALTADVDIASAIPGDAAETYASGYRTGYQNARRDVARVVKAVLALATVTVPGAGESEVEEKQHATT